MGIMALHIQKGEHPVFFYGQAYMGALEAYLGAGLFFLSGRSAFSLRLGLILLYLFFLLCLYLLTARLYTRRFGLFILLLLSLGSNVVLSRQLNALGGYMEILLCGMLSFLLALWLADTTTHAPPRSFWRWMGYTCWGIVVGIGLWSDLLLLPTILCSGLVLLCFCWQDLRRGALLLLLLGMLIGAFPLILHNLHAAPGQDSWSVLINMQGAPAFSISSIAQQVSRTMLYSLPAITGNPVCHTDDMAGLKFLGFEPVQAMSSTCITIRVGWSCVYLCLLLCVIGWQIIQVRTHLLGWRKDRLKRRLSTEFIRAAVGLAMAIQAALTLYSFIRSHAPLDGASVYARYLICLWIATPVLLWPLWKSAQRICAIPGPRTILAGIALLSTVIIMSYGSIETLSEIPQARAAYAWEEKLIASLAQHGIQHVYTDYWTCYRLAFQSAERITCGVLAGGCSLQSGMHNRYPPYYEQARRDPNAAYLLDGNTKCASALQRKGYHYRFATSGYLVYQSE
ncbi:hypothetical protein KDI_45170 [Dictyobacter arantiisoli]|uniref:Glycosyltransferase RgtA/B/C/D-like domain-containing protein n=2 Tax=Dictyobacter arantiisoli TaxID=2014874 RepID=A0A5A5TIY4_9CHLR|nr:hypothetical protein KDI_45170 [Dictyobacter arantiisoli]